MSDYPHRAATGPFKVLLSCLLLLFLIGCGKKQEGQAGGKTDVDTLTVLATHISACSKLYTAQYDLRKILIYTDTTTLNGNFLNQHVKVNVPFSDRRIAIPVTATAKGYIDLGRLKKSDIVRQGDKLEIILPDPEIALTAQTNILEDAKENAARVIIPLAVQCGYREENVTVAFRKDFINSDLQGLIRLLD